MIEMDRLREGLMESFETFTDEAASKIARAALNGGLSCWIGRNDSGFHVMHYISDNSGEWFEMIKPPASYTPLKSLLEGCVACFDCSSAKELATILRDYADKIEGEINE